MPTKLCFVGETCITTKYNFVTRTCTSTKLYFIKETYISTKLSFVGKTCMPTKQQFVGKNLYADATTCVRKRVFMLTKLNFVNKNFSRYGYDDDLVDVKKCVGIT